MVWGSVDTEGAAIWIEAFGESCPMADKVESRESLSSIRTHNSFADLRVSLWQTIKVAKTSASCTAALQIMKVCSLRAWRFRMIGSRCMGASLSSFPSTRRIKVNEQWQAFNEFRNNIDPGVVEINEANLFNLQGNCWIWAKPPDMLYQFSNSRREDVARIEVCVSTNDIATWSAVCCSDALSCLQVLALLQHALYSFSSNYDTEFPSQPSFLSETTKTSKPRNSSH